MSGRGYWEERHRDLPPMRAVGSINHSVAYNRWLYRVRRRAFMRAVKELELRPTHVLDVGSGTGFYIQQWQRLRVPNIVGSDIAQPAVRALRENFPGLEIREVDITAPCDLGSFDAVSAFDVLFHIVEDEAYTVALSNIHDALRPGGIFLFSEHLPHRPIPSRSHRVSRTLDEVTERLAQAGFELVWRRPTFWWMYPPLEPERHQILRRLWSGRSSRVVRSELAGGALGATLYPLEAITTGLAREGPHTHLVAARRRD